MKDLVLVKSKTINNESVPVVFRIVEVGRGELRDEREISRSYVFENFEATMPLKHARVLVKQNPNEFRIVKAASNEPSKAVQNAVKTSKETDEGFVCPKCKDRAKSKAGLTAHIRYNHPELFAEMYPPKAKEVKSKTKQKETK